MSSDSNSDSESDSSNDPDNPIILSYLNEYQSHRYPTYSHPEFDPRKRRPWYGRMSFTDRTWSELGGSTASYGSGGWREDSLTTFESGSTERRLPRHGDEVLTVGPVEAPPRRRRRPVGSSPLRNKLHRRSSQPWPREPETDQMLVAPLFKTERLLRSRAREQLQLPTVRDHARSLPRLQTVVLEDPFTDPYGVGASGMANAEPPMRHGLLPWEEKPSGLSSSSRHTQARPERVPQAASLSSASMSSERASAPTSITALTKKTDGMPSKKGGLLSRALKKLGSRRHKE